MRLCLSMGSLDPIDRLIQYNRMSRVPFCTLRQVGVYFLSTQFTYKPVWISYFTLDPFLRRPDELTITVPFSPTETWWLPERGRRIRMGALEGTEITDDVQTTKRNEEYEKTRTERDVFYRRMKRKTVGNSDNRVTRSVTTE